MSGGAVKRFPPLLFPPMFFGTITLMASAADSMASGISLSKFSQATDLKKRLWFTIGALIIFRMLSYVPLPGIDPSVLSQLVAADLGRRARFLQRLFRAARSAG